MTKTSDNEFLDEETIGFIAGGIAMLVAAWLILPSLIVGVLFYRKVWRFWPKSAYIAIVGVVWVVGMWLVGVLPNLYGTAWHSFKSAGGLGHLGDALGSSLPELGIAWLVAPAGNAGHLLGLRIATTRQL